MAKVKVTALKPLRYERKRHPVGAVISMEKEHADALPAGTVESVTSKPAADKTVAEAAAAAKPAE